MMKTCLSYRFLIWSVLIILIATSVFEKLLLPLKNERNNDKNEKLFKRENISVSLIELFWMISRRILLVCCNVSFFTMMYAFPNIMTEMAPKWIDMNTRRTHSDVHKFVGIWLTGVPVLLHVVLLCVPLVANGYSAKFIQNGWNFFEWRDSCTRGFEYFLENTQKVYYSYDEIFRFSLTIITFCIAFPISRSAWMLKKSYSWAMFLHMVFGFLYFYDLIRKTSHPLAFYFSIPVIAAYVIDRLMSMFWYRTHKFETYCIKLLGHNHVLVYGRIPSLGIQNFATADNFYILHDLLNPLSILKIQRAHLFHTFQNHDPNTFHSWNVAFVMEVYSEGLAMDIALSNGEIGFKKGENKKSILFIKDNISNAASLPKDMEIKPGNCLLPVLRVWGPYRSAFYGLNCIERNPVVLVAEGAGLTLILSALNILKRKYEDRCGVFKRLHIIYVSEHDVMFDYLINTINEILGHHTLAISVYYSNNPENLDSHNLECIDFEIACAQSTTSKYKAEGQTNSEFYNVFEKDEVKDLNTTKPCNYILSNLESVEDSSALFNCTFSASHSMENSSKQSSNVKSKVRDNNSENSYSKNVNDFDNSSNMGPDQLNNSLGVHNEEIDQSSNVLKVNSSGNTEDFCKLNNAKFNEAFEDSHITDNEEDGHFETFKMKFKNSVQNIQEPETHQESDDLKCNPIESSSFVRIEECNESYMCDIYPEKSYTAKMQNFQNLSKGSDQITEDWNKPYDQSANNVEKPLWTKSYFNSCTEAKLPMVSPNMTDLLKGIKYKSASLYFCKPHFSKLFDKFKGQGGYCYCCGSSSFVKSVGKAAKSALLEFKEESL